MADQWSLTENIDIFPIFKSWELCDETCHILLSFGITSTTILKKMEIEDVENLFSKVDQKYTGELIKFKAGLRERRRNINLPFMCERDTLSANSRILEWLEKISDKLSSSGFTDSPLSTQTSADNSICGTTLINLLKSTVKGHLVLTFYEKNNYIDSKNQKTLVHCIIEKYVGTRSKLTYAEMQQWSYAICEVFPKEKPETYFLKRKDGKKNPTGKLFSRWTNVEKEKSDDYPATAEESATADEKPVKYSINFTDLHLYKRTNKIIFRGKTFKVNYIVTVTIDDALNIYEIVDFLCKEDNIKIVGKKLINLNFSQRFQSYLIGNETETFNVIDLIDIDGPPIHFYLLNNGLKVIRVKKYW